MSYISKIKADIEHKDAEIIAIKNNISELLEKEKHQTEILKQLENPNTLLKRLELLEEDLETAKEKLQLAKEEGYKYEMPATATIAQYAMIPLGVFLVMIYASYALAFFTTPNPDDVFQVHAISLEALMDANGMTRMMCLFLAALPLGMAFALATEKISNVLKISLFTVVLFLDFAFAYNNISNKIISEQILYPEKNMANPEISTIISDMSFWIILLLGFGSALIFSFLLKHYLSALAVRDDKSKFEEHLIYLEERCNAIREKISKVDDFYRQELLEEKQKLSEIKKELEKAINDKAYNNSILDKLSYQLSKFESDLSIPISPKDFDAMKGEFMGGWNAYLSGSLEQELILVATENAGSTADAWANNIISEMSDTFVLT